MKRCRSNTQLNPPYILNAHSNLIRAKSIPLDRCPAAVYLAQLKQSSRRPQKQALELVASLLTSGAADCLTINWGAIRYQHTAAVRGRLLDGYAPATANRILSAPLYVECLNKLCCLARCLLKTITARLVWHPLLEKHSRQRAAS